MGFWSYVCCFITIDSKESVDNFTNIFGKEFHPYDEHKDTEIDWENIENHPEEYLPMGSEGSLHMDIVCYKRKKVKRYPYRYKLEISGSLRDFVSYEELMRWLNRSIKKFKQNYSSSAMKIILKADCDYNGSYKYVHEDYGWKDSDD